MNKRLRKLIAEKEYDKVLDEAEKYHNEYKLEKTEDILCALYDAVLDDLGAGSDLALKLQESLADIYFRLGKYEDSLSLYNSLLSRYKQEYGEESDKVSFIITEIAHIYLVFGRYEEAEKYCQRTLRISLKNNGEKNDDSIKAISIIADAYFNMNRYNDALLYYEYELRLLDSIGETKSERRALALNSLGRLYSDTYNTEKALDYSLKAYDMLTEVCGSENENALLILNDIASMYGDLHVFDKELETKLKVLEDAKKLYGFDHPNVNVARSNLAVAYSHLGDYKKFLELSLEALKWAEENLSRTHHERIRLLSAAGRAYLICDEPEKALEYEEQIYDTLCSLYGRSHPKALEAAMDTAICYFDMDKLENAEFLVSSVLEACGDNKDENPAFYIYALGFYAQLRCKTGHCSEAVQLSEEAIRLIETSGLQRSDDLYLAYSTKAEALSELGSYEEAISFAETALDIVSRNYGEHHPRTKNIKETLDKIIAKRK